MIAEEIQLAFILFVMDVSQYLRQAVGRYIIMYFYSKFLRIAFFNSSQITWEDYLKSILISESLRDLFWVPS